MRYSMLCALPVIVLVMLLGQFRTAAAWAESIRVNGSGSALYVMKPLIKAYAQAHPGVRVEMEKPLGSSGAIKALLAGMLDIAVSSKVLQPDEMSQGCISIEYGKMPLAVVAGKNVLRKNVTTKELEDIYSGKVLKWANSEPVRLILRPDADIDTKILEGLSPGMGKAVRVAHVRRGMIVAVTDPESDEMVARIPGSLGAAALSAIMVEKASFRVLALNGIMPSVGNLANGTYPLAKDIRFVTTRNSSPALRRFINFIYSPQGRAIAGKAGVLVTAKGGNTL